MNNIGVIHPQRIDIHQNFRHVEMFRNQFYCPPILFTLDVLMPLFLKRLEVTLVSLEVVLP